MPKKRAKRKRASTSKGKGQPSQLARPLQCSRALSLLLSDGADGCLYLKRSDVVKRVWAYARERGLKAPDDGRIILCDAPMRAAFATARLTITTLPTHLAPHLTSVAPKARAGESAPPELATMLWASPQLSQLVARSGIDPTGGVPRPGSALRVGGVPQLQITLKEGLRWLGAYAKNRGLRDEVACS